MQIPSDASGLTAVWLSDVLAVAPGGPFGPVEQVERQRIGEGVGVMSEIYRLAIRYAPDGRPGPATLVAKVPAGTAEARGLANNYGFYEKEVAFYRDIAPTVSIATPRCFGAAFDTDSKLFVLLMEDMAAVTPGDPFPAAIAAGISPIRTAINRNSILPPRTPSGECRSGCGSANSDSGRHDATSHGLRRSGRRGSKCGVRRRSGPVRHRLG